MASVQYSFRLIQSNARSAAFAWATICKHLLRLRKLFLTAAAARLFLTFRDGNDATFSGVVDFSFVRIISDPIRKIVGLLPSSSSNLSLVRANFGVALHELYVVNTSPVYCLSLEPHKAGTKLISECRTIYSF